MSGSTWPMSIDCIENLYKRFSTQYCLVIQDDGFPMRENLDEFIGRWDFIGAPIVRDSFRTRLTEPLGIRALNGGFSLRSRAICMAAAKAWKMWGRFIIRPGMRFFSEDVFYTVTARFSPFYRLKYRFPTDQEAFRFAFDSLSGLVSLPQDVKPFGFHGKLTALTLCSFFNEKVQASESSLNVNSGENFFEGNSNPENDATRVILISVVRDLMMYNRCLVSNRFLKRCILRKSDNSSENIPIPIRYNHFFESYDFSRESWFVFCHEDFEFKEDPVTLISSLNKSLLYGPIGAATRTYLGLLQVCQYRGQIISSDKSGDHIEKMGRVVDPGTRVDTLDCQCLIVHSSLIRKTGIRFDQNLTFDLYVEDFCLQALTRWGIKTIILPLKCQHWSKGPKPAAYNEKLQYLATKYPNKCYAGTVAYIGSPCCLQKVNFSLKKVVRWFLCVLHRG